MGSISKPASRMVGDAAKMASLTGKYGPSPYGSRPYTGLDLKRNQRTLADSLRRRSTPQTALSPRPTGLGGNTV
jgi:hypothetical protein